METYTITRMFFDENRPNETIATGLTLDEAQEHCNDPETSSSTASDPTAVDPGPWFDGYDEE